MKEKLAEITDEIEAYVPMRRMVKRRRGYGKSVEFVCPVFSRYLFMRLWRSESQLWALRQTRINFDFLRNDSLLSEIHELEVARLKRSELAGEFDALPVAATLHLHKGQVVMLPLGGARNFRATIVRTPSSNDKNVLVDFGHATGNIPLGFFLARA